MYVNFNFFYCFIKYTLVKEWKLEKKKGITCISWIKRCNSVWVSAEDVKHIRVFNPQGNLQHFVPIAKSTLVCAIREHVDFIWVGAEKTIILFDSKTLERYVSWNAHPEYVVSIVVLDSTNVWTASNNGEICVWNINQAQISCTERRIEQGGQQIVSLHSWKENNRIISTSNDHILLWDTEVCLFVFFSSFVVY